MKIGHWFYGGHHELLTLNLKLAFESGASGVASSHDGSVSQFLIRNFINALGVHEADIRSDAKGIYYRTMVERNCHVLSQELGDQDAIVVYMSHTVTDRIIEAFLQLIESESLVDKHSESPLTRIRRKVIGLTPIRRNRRGSGLQISGLARDKLYKHAERGVPVVIFDDAVVSGRTYSDLKGILREAGFKDVRSLAIVDRQRLPSAQHIDNKRHICYWRFDVPTLGEGHTCALCLGRSRVKQFSESLASAEHKELLEKWIAMWRPVDPTTEWGDGGLRPIPIKLKNRYRKFGIQRDDPYSGRYQQIGGDAQLVQLVNSAGVAAYIAELHSITSRDDLVTRMMLEEDHTPESRIQIIATQLLLFYGEFDGALAQELGVLLLDSLWTVQRSDRTSALAFVTFISCGRTFLRSVATEFFRDGTRIRYLSSRAPEVLLLLAYISKSATNSEPKMEWLSQVEALQGILEPTGKIEVLEWLHRLVLDSAGKSHSTALHRFLRTADSGNLSREFLGDVQSCLSRLRSLMPHVRPFWLSRAVEKLATAAAPSSIDSLFVSIAEEIGLLLNSRASSVNRAAALRRAHAHAKAILAAAEALHDALFSRVGLSGLRKESANSESLVLSRLRTFLTHDRLPLEVRLPGENMILFYSPSPGEVDRQIEELKKPGLDEAYCLWDANVEEAMIDIASNARHATAPIRCPWSAHIAGSAYMWVRVRLGRDRIQIDFTNKVKYAKRTAAEAAETITPAKAFVADCGGDIRFEADIKSQLTTTVSLPYAHTLQNINHERSKRG
jgi:hypothetical protein